MASVDSLTVLPRPRSAWQAMDAGFTLARPHFFKLALLWSVFAAPFFVLPHLIFPSNPMIALWIGWWFKPLYEVPILIYLSSALFGEHLKVRDVLKRSLKHIPRLLGSYLTYARFSPHRSLTLPVVILEQLPFKARRARIGVLTAAVNRAFSLQMVSLHVEYLLNYALMVILLFLIPTEESFEFYNFFENLFDDEILPNWFWNLSTACVFIAAACVAPFYIGAGFMLYINRRMKIEAWDIEHQFRRIARVKAASDNTTTRGQSVQIILACVLFGSIVLPSPSEAQTQAQTQTQTQAQTQAQHTPSTAAPTTGQQTSNADSTDTKMNSASAAGSTELVLDSGNLPSIEETRTLIQEIKAHSEFGSTQDKRVLKFKKRPKKASKESDFDFPDWLSNFQWIADGMQTFANLMQWLLWILAAFLIVLALLAIQRFLPENVRASLSPRRRIKERTSFVAHPLTTNLPSNIPKAAQDALNNGNKREALSLLYRGAIRALINEHELPVPKAATESECLALVKASAAAPQKSAFSEVVSLWQQCAYAKVEHAETLINSTIQSWPTAFAGGSTAQTKKVST